MQDRKAGLHRVLLFAPSAAVRAVKGVRADKEEKVEREANAGLVGFGRVGTAPNPGYLLLNGRPIRVWSRAKSTVRAGREASKEASVAAAGVAACKAERGANAAQPSVLQGRAGRGANEGRLVSSVRVVRGARAASAVST